MPKHTDLTPIDAIDLFAVTGGTHRPGHNNTATQAALASITDSIKAIGAQNTNSNGGISQLLPLMLLAKGGAGGCPGGNCGR